MLDLNKLEQQIDGALARETKESLTTWLLEKRGKIDTFPCVSKLSVQKHNGTLGWGLGNIEDGTFQISNALWEDYGRWSMLQKIQTIESMLIDLSLPTIYIRQCYGYSDIIESGVWVCCLLDFTTGNFALKDLLFYRAFEGKRFKDFTKPEVRHLQLCGCNACLIRCPNIEFQDVLFKIKYILR